MTLRVAIGPSTFASPDDSPLRRLRARGIEIIPNPHGRRLNEQETIHLLRKADGLLAGLEPLNRDVLFSAPRLRAVARVGVGTANVDFEAARERGIKVSITPEGPTAAVAEMTVGAMIALSRGLIQANEALHQGRWEKSIGLGLIGSKVLIIGYGRIGKRVAMLLRPFGPEVLVADPMAAPETLVQGERLVALDAGLREADVITLHAAGDSVILGPDEFACMKQGVFLLNGARGELVDESALVGGLATGRVAGAWFDAYWQEPYAGPLTRFAQVLLTPHTATYTRQCRLAMEMDAVNNLLRDLGLEARP